MTKKFILIINILFIFTIQATAKLEVTANNIHSTENMVYADDGVVVYYNDTVIKAKFARFDKTKKILILDKDVEIIGYDGTKEFTNHMELQTETKEASFKQLFFAGENDIWLLSESAYRKNEKYILGKSILSSCDVKDPLWEMVFSDASYDSKEEYMKVYNARVHLGGIPIFYTPYFAFSTNKNRSSGLLFPGIGYNEIEGILYEQPIYWAISESMDLELNPQIRTLRSMGVYGSFRFADSNHSEGIIRGGYFKDKQSYIDEYKPLHDNHYGIEFNYESTDVFQSALSKDMVDGLYINLTYLNDIDYLNLQKHRLTHFGTRPRQESRINYFLYNDNYYSGINAKYFIDTRAENNKNTLQILPSIQWHKYLSPIIIDNLTYSIDTHINNITRVEGTTMKQAEIKVPLEFTASLFKDYLNISAKNEFYYSKYLFGNKTFEYNNFQYMSNTQNVKLYTDLTKRYSENIHVLEPSFEYSLEGKEKQSPISFNALSKDQTKLFSVALPEKHYSFGLKQYIYDDDMNILFSHRLSQRYYPNREYKPSELENEMEYNLDDWTFYNDVTYSHKFKAIHSMASSIELDTDNYEFSLGHTYKQYLREEGNTIARNDLNFDFKYSFNQRVRMYGAIKYNLLKKESRQWAYGLGYFKDCWSIDASVSKQIRATSKGPEELTTFYLQLNFVPFGGIGTGDFE